VSVLQRFLGVRVRFVISHQIIGCAEQPRTSKPEGFQNNALGREGGRHEASRTAIGKSIPERRGRKKYEGFCPLQD